MVRTFKYTKTGVEGLVERTVIVLNEDETRIGKDCRTYKAVRKYSCKEFYKKTEGYSKGHILYVSLQLQGFF